ncbi:MAG: AAA family ATPase [Candidatus Hodarchaeota archaeon]
MVEEEVFAGMVQLVAPEDPPSERIGQFSVRERGKELHASISAYQKMHRDLEAKGLVFGGRTLLTGPLGTDFEEFIHYLRREVPLKVIRVSLEKYLENTSQFADAVRVGFEYARRNSPCILYISRLERIATHQSSHSLPLQVELEQTTWDNDEVLTVISTSAPDSVDRELLATFDRTFIIEAASLDDRIRLLETLLKGRSDLDPTLVAELTNGWSFDDVKTLAVSLLMTEEKGESQATREAMELLIEQSRVFPFASKQRVRELSSRMAGSETPSLSEVEQVYPDEFLDQLYLMAVGDDYHRTQAIIETLNSGLPLSASDQEYLSRYPFLMNGNAEERLTRLLRAKKSNDRLRRIMGRQ